MAANLIHSLTCPICLKFCVEPVETICCHKIYCIVCADNLNGICALCRQNIGTNNKIKIDVLENSRGLQSRLGSTGKYYCGQALDVRCTCCNGLCGPTNGCNCSSCMELDIKSRNLPQGWLVNSDGYVSRRKTQNELFYCGRKVMDQRECDGYCGPNNGPNCNSCKRLDQMTRHPNDRYSNCI